MSHNPSERAAQHAAEQAAELLLQNSERSAHILRSGLLSCSGGLLLELLAFVALMSGRLHLLSAIGALLAHALACAITARALHSMMPPSQQTPRRTGLMFLFAITFFMPMFGSLGMLGGLLAELYYSKHRPKQQPWMTIGYPELPTQPPMVAARAEYGDGALSAMLRYSPNPERRISAVLAARHLRDHNDAEVLRLALSDMVDDVRLLAYSILDRREQAFNTLLKTFLSQIESAAPEQRAKLHKRLAQTHFEMIQLGLSQGEVQSYLLTEARHHVDVALQEEPDDRESLFLLGCIALRQEDFHTAEKAFLKAQVMGMALEKVLPYLAEIAFRQQKFSTVTHYLRAIGPLYFRTQPLLSGIAAHWLPEESQCLPR